MGQIFLLFLISVLNVVTKSSKKMIFPPGPVQTVQKVFIKGKTTAVIVDAKLTNILLKVIIYQGIVDDRTMALSCYDLKFSVKRVQFALKKVHFN